nr:hypothetical protein [uncultured Acetatifactor sp.]
MRMLRRLVAADQIPFFVIALILMHMHRRAVAADQLPGIVIALGHMDVVGVMAADQVALFIVAAVLVDVELRPILQRRHFLRSQLYRLEAAVFALCMHMDMLFQLEQLAGYPAALYQLALFIEAFLAVAAVVMCVELQLPADQRGDFLIALLGVDMAFAGLGAFLQRPAALRRRRFPAPLSRCGRGLGVAGFYMFMLFQGADQILGMAALCVGVLLFSTGHFLCIAALLVRMLLQSAGHVPFFVCAALSMGMLCHGAGKGLGGAAFPVGVLFREAADDCVFIAALSVGMGLLAANRSFRHCRFGRRYRGLFPGRRFRFRRGLFPGGSLCLFRRLLGRFWRLFRSFRRLLRRFRVLFRGNGHFRLLQLADQDFLGEVALFLVLMLLMLFQSADQIALRVIAGIVVRMDGIKRITADRLCPQVPVLVPVVAFFCMLVHLVLAVQHFHLVGHGLAIQLQSRDRTESHYHSQAQENNHLASILFVFLQKLRRLC